MRVGGMWVCVGGCLCVCVVLASTEDLPRMSSIQSDSSGFGDTEVSGDNAAQEMASLKVGHTQSHFVYRLLSKL